MAYFYLVPTSRVQAWLSIAGNSASAEKFGVFINEVYSSGADNDSYQSIPEHELSKAVFLLRTGIYMLSSYLKTTAEYNNKTLVRIIEMKIGCIKNIKKVEVYCKKSTKPQSFFTPSKAHVAYKINSM